MMFQVSYYIRRSLLVGNSLRCRCNFSFACAKTLEFSRSTQSTPLFTSCRLAHSTLNVQNQQLIYEGPMAYNVRLVKCITLATSFISIPFQIYVLLTNEEIINSSPLTVMVICFIVFQTITPLLIHFVAKRYVLRIYHNAVTDKYTIETYKLFPTIKYTTFRVTECRAPKFEIFATAVVKEKFPVFFDPRYFTDMEHYRRLLGYDKPIDFSDDSEENTKEISECKNDVQTKEKPS